MQIKKDHVREQIASVAKEVFLRKGFVKTSMRNIAEGAGLSVSNLYNYFENKDELFRYIVSPLVMEMEGMLQEHHNMRYHEKFNRYANGESNDMIPEHMQAYINLIGNHLDELRLVFFKAQGSSMESFVDDYTDECTRQVVEFMDAYRKKHPRIGAVRTEFSYHIHTVWLFSFLSEIVKHRLSPEETKEAVADYMLFEFAGWSSIMNSK